MRSRAALLLALVLWGCQGRDQQARATGESARKGAAQACASSAPEEIEPCLQERCAGPCAAYESTKTFQRECIHACVARGECATDADCGPGTRCVAIAPRVRRCEPSSGFDAGL